MEVVYILFAHYLLDYPLQGDFLATTKGKYTYSLLAHSLIYGLGMGILFNFMGHFDPWKMMILIYSHIVIDYVKANAKDKDKALTTYLYIDQALHIAIALSLYFIF